MRGHAGNKQYWDYLLKHVSLFEHCVNDTEKQFEIAKGIIDHVENTFRGRFLETDGKKHWVAHKDTALAKVRRALKEKYERESKAGAKKKSAKKFPPDGVEGGREQTIHKTSSKPAPRKRWAEEGQMPSQPKRTREVVEAVQPHPIKQEEEPVSWEEVMRPPEEYIYQPDPNKFYMEETAHRYHDPPFPSKKTTGVLPKDLRHIPPPPPLPSLPNTGACTWSFDEETRVLTADFSVGRQDGPLQMTKEDSKFLFEMQEKDDITVISRGLLNMSKLDPSLWNWDYLRYAEGEEFFHKFRRFDRSLDDEGYENFTERDNLYSMRFADFARYCYLRKSFLEKKKHDPAIEETTFTFEDHKGVEHTLGVWTSALYLIDMDIKRSMPSIYDNFIESFDLPAVLPGGSNCMMNDVTSSARPFMGPNMYITPPAAFTHFHQDGHGTVDSGHLCIHGYNEIIMLRRLTERHKKHALWILSGKPTDASDANPSYFDGLYSEPHGDNLGAKPKWASTEMIEECKRMG
jgi:hypothetical protein